MNWGGGILEAVAADERWRLMGFGRRANDHVASKRRRPNRDGGEMRKEANEW